MKRPPVHPWLDRLWAVAGAVSIRTKILGIILILVLLLGLGITLQVRFTVTQMMNTLLQEQSVSVARDVAARATDPILINNLYALHELLRETRANNADVRYAFIVDAQGRVLAHTFGDGFPDGLLASNGVTADQHHHTVMLNTDEGAVWDTAIPIFDGRAGVARVGISEAGVRRAINAVTGQLLLTTVVVSVFGVTAAAFLTWILTRPILNLVQAAHAVGRGDFSQHVARWADDEIGELSAAFNAMTAALSRAERERAEREELRLQYAKGVIAAQEDERKRIARELHDSTGQSLTSLMLGLRTLSHARDQSEIQLRTEELRDIAAQTLDEVHTLALQLRPSILDDMGLAAALERHVADCRNRYPIRIDLAMRGLNGKRLPPEVETALYRIAQEALNNIARHAQAQTASVLLEREDDSVRAVIEDDGVGFDPTAAARTDGRLGLYGMRERAELLGGRLTIESAAGQGTSLFVEIPVAPGASRG